MLLTYASSSIDEQTDVQGDAAGDEHLALVVIVPSEQQRLARAEQLAAVKLLPGLALVMPSSPLCHTLQNWSA